MLAQLAPCTARSQSCCQTPCCPTISSTGLKNQKYQSFINFGLLKLSLNLGLFGKSLLQLYLYYFFSFIFTLVTHRFMHNCICIVLYCSFTHGYFVLYMAIRLLWPQSWSLNLTWLDLTPQSTPWRRPCARRVMTRHQSWSIPRLWRANLRVAICRSETAVYAPFVLLAPCRLIFARLWYGMSISQLDLLVD